MTKENNYYGASKEDLTKLLSVNREYGPLEIKVYLGISSEQAQEISRKMDSSSYYSDPMPREVIHTKYLTNKEKGPIYLWHRVADAISSVEFTKEKKEQFYYEFMNQLDDFKFVPGGRILYGAGREDAKTTLNNCYVVGIKNDNIEEIYSALTNQARTFKAGGGCGHDLSNLRPRGSETKRTGGKAGGPVGFMELFSTNTNTIAQEGRRGASMQTLRIDHPEIKDFIRIKSDSEHKRVRYSNISVLVTDEFMDALKEDRYFELKFPDVDDYGKSPVMKKFYQNNWGNGNHEHWIKIFNDAQEKGEIPTEFKPFKVYEKIKASKLWNEITQKARDNAEPGIIFWDEMKRNHNLEYINPLVSTNPCGEQPLPDGGCCNLGAINLERFVENEKINWSELEKTVKLGVRFLDNVIDYNSDRHPLEEQKKNALEDRRIGLGIMGLADMILKLGLRYDSEEAIKKTEDVMSFIRDNAYETSIEIGEEKGVFPNFQFDGYSKSKFVQNLPEKIIKEIKEKGIRNGTILTVAPTGSGSIIAEVSSGIEPIFAVNYERKVKKTDSAPGREEYDTFKIMHPSVKKMFGDIPKEDLPEIVLEAHDIDFLSRVKLQGAIQKYIDSSISSTINLPEEISSETVREIYSEAYKRGLKGVTVYRENSREGIIKSGKNLESKIVKLDVELKNNSIRKGANVDYYRIERFNPRIGENEKFHVSFVDELWKDEKSGNVYLFPSKIFQNKTPLGYENSAEFAQSGLDRTRRLYALDVDLVRMVSELKSVMGHISSGIGSNVINSPSHGVGLALEHHLLENGILSYNSEGKLVQKVSKKDLIQITDEEEIREIINGKAKKLEKLSQDIFGNIKGKEFECPNCRENSYHRESGCPDPVCNSCGWSAGNC